MNQQETHGEERGHARPWFGRGFGGPRFGFGPGAWFVPGRRDFDEERPGGGPFGGPFGGRGGHHGPFGGPRGPWFGRGNQIGRGGVRVALLSLLAEQPMHGYQMMRELGDRSRGTWQPSPGSIYPVLQMLEDEGLVRANAQADGRRVYELTEAGRNVVAAYKGERPPWEEAATRGEGGPRELHQLVRSLLGAVRQVGQTGNPAQIAQARDVLIDTRRSLYRILADESSGAGSAGEESPGATPTAETSEF
jgi:DNA-binding PadR family transcriptional regulator